MHNGWAVSQIQQLPPRLFGGTWHPTYKELPCAGQNSYQRTSTYRLPPCIMQEPSHLQLQRGRILCNSRGGPCNKDKGRGDGVGALECMAKKGAHRYIPEVKDNNIICLGCENVNSLSIFHPTKSKMHKLTHLHQRHQTDGVCTVEQGINFKMTATGTCPEDLLPGMCSSRVSAGHNIHKLHICYQQGGTMIVAFSQLASYALLSGVDQTGLSCWSWIQVGTGEHWTKIGSAYQPCH
jgi:hypothetical protein